MNYQLVTGEEKTEYEELWEFRTEPGYLVLLNKNGGVICKPADADHRTAMLTGKNIEPFTVAILDTVKDLEDADSYINDREILESGFMESQQCGDCQLVCWQNNRREQVERMGLSKCMQEAVKLLQKGEFYLWETRAGSAWRADSLPETIKTNTMKALERRGVVKIEIESGRSISKVAKLIMAEFEELSASDDCIRCPQSYQNRNFQYRCRKIGKVVVGMDGRATVKAMKCH